ncbi:hypothetical protein GALL_396640 [mine drainage metagenome]|uniref:Uncharacterized protein n=1 Tax=mine drainage metagenome TaxID=410659 RepID=A0A1J5QF79_9ZZZZ
MPRRSQGTVMDTSEPLRGCRVECRPVMDPAEAFVA